MSIGVTASPEAYKIYPPPSEKVSPQDIHAGPVADTALPTNDRQDRPHIMINMVSSLDGKAAVDGKASPIGSETDRLVMRSLRSKADAVMTGAGTLRAEKLDLRAPGKGTLSVIISASGDFPLENVVHDSPEHLLVFTTTAIPPVRVREISRRARVENMLPPDRPDQHLHLLLKSLKDSYGVSVLLVEGGPGLNYSLINGGHVDEVFTTIAPKLLGGSPEKAPGIIHGPQLPPDTTVQLALTSVYTAEDELYLRYSMRSRNE